MAETNKQRGRIGLSMAINYFTCHGYTVSLPMNDTQWYDMIVEKDGIFQTVQCKCTDTENNEISLRSMGGTSGSVYDRITNHSELDYLFCVSKKRNMYLIPIEDLIQAGNKNRITLRTEPNKNNQGFQTYKYQVQFLG